MLSDSLGGLLGIGQGSLGDLGGSIGDQLGDGIGSAGDLVEKIFDSVSGLSSSPE